MNPTVVAEIASKVRDIPDFPKAGIVFKDITPLLQDPVMYNKVLEELASSIPEGTEAIVGIESRGFWWGCALAKYLNIPFVPVRKKGKMPYKTYSVDYALEYGSASLEIHIDSLKPGTKVVIHDDVLATGGTVIAASELIKMCGGIVAGFNFLIEISVLEGREKISKISKEVSSVLLV